MAAESTTHPWLRRAPWLLGTLIVASLLLAPVVTGEALRTGGLLEAAGGATLATLCSGAALAASRRPGRPVPLRLALPAVLAVSAGNAVTPAGVGGTVLAHRFHRRTGMSTPEANAALAVRAVAGSIAAFSGGLFAASYAGAVTRHAPLPSGRLLAGGGAVVLAVLTTGLVVQRRRVRALLVTAAATLRSASGHLRSPGRSMLLLLAAHGLLVGQIICLHGALNAVGLAPSLAVLLVAQVGANTVKSASPWAPGGLGAMEGALVAALHGGGLPAGAAAMGVLVYRAMGWWLPVLGGVVVLGAFRRRGLV
jgi:uncharacterized membrane protein YbhN (UPF0104 family)